MDEEFLNKMIASLNRLEIKGRENMSIVLGCIIACEQKLSDLATREDSDDGK